MGKAGALVGTVAFMAAGGLIGGLFTAGAFSTVGMSVGTLVGGMVLGQKPQTGASDPAQTGVADAGFLPIFCGGDIPDPAQPGNTLDGGAWIPGRIVSCPPAGGITRVRQNTQAQSTGGKVLGGGGSGDSHFGNFAVAWSEGSEEHPVELLELKAGDKVLFRLGAAPNEDGYVARTPAVNPQNGKVYGWHSDNFRHYYGTSSQLPDDIVSTWWDGGHAPALRGTSYTVIVNLQIDEWGQIPPLYARLSNGVVKRIDQCKFFLLRANGLDGEEVLPPSAINLSKIKGYSRAWFLTQPEAPRVIAEKIASRSFCALVEHSYHIWDVDLANPTIHVLENWELGARSSTSSEDGEPEHRPRFKRGLDEAIKSPSRVELRYVDARRNDEYTVSALMPTAQHENVLSVDLPTVDVEEDMTAWAQVTLDAAYVGRTPGEISVLPRRFNIFPGDVVRIPNRAGTAYTDMIVRERLMAAPGAINLKGIGWNRSTYAAPPKIIPTPQPIKPSIYGASLVFVSNAVSFTKQMLSEPGVIVAVSQRPLYKWPLAVTLNAEYADGAGWDKDWDDNWRTARALMGQLSSPWNVPDATDAPQYDDGSNALEVEMLWGALATATEYLARDGANTILFENGLIVSFAVATQTGLTAQGTGFYSLDGLLVARWGSSAGAATIPAGSRFIVLYDEKKAQTPGWSFRGLGQSKVGRHARFRVPILDKPTLVGIREFDFSGANRRPVAPVVDATRTDDGGLRLVGRARARGRDDASAPLSELRLSQGYGFSLLVNGHTQTRWINNDSGVFDFVWTGAQLAALLGEDAATIGEVDVTGILTSLAPAEMKAGLPATWSAPGTLAP